MNPHNFRYFLIPYLLLAILGLMFASIANHGDAVLLMNGVQNDFLNYFFRIWTYGGDGFVFGIVAAGLLIWKRRYGFVFLLIGLVQGLISWSMKHFFFDGTPRPKKYFEGQDVLKLIEGVKVHDFNSFPSGHTMTAFAIATFLSLIIKKRGWSILLLFIAVFVGLSRVYLNQHFMIDITVGSFIGVMVSYVGHQVFEKYLNREI